MLAGRTLASRHSRPSRRFPSWPRSRLAVRLEACLAVAALLAFLTGCQTGPTAPTLVRIENHQVVPPNYFGFISEGHPDYPTSVDVPPRHKVVPPEVMDDVLALLDEDGFDTDSHAAAMPGPEVEPLPILRRILRVVGKDSRALVVPRQPDPALAQKFSNMARELGRLFNQVDYLRREEDLEDPDLFRREQERLEQRNQRLPDGGSR